MTSILPNPHYTYTADFKPNQLICGSGQIAIVTGWTVRKSVSKKLDPTEYAVIGNLYSPTRGITPLIRNLLANPHVRFLVILNATREDKNAGGCQCLLDFLNNGFTKGKSDTDKECWVINSNVKGYIDIEIDELSLNTLRNSLIYLSCNSISEILDIIKEFNQRPCLEPWGIPLSFPVSSNTPTVLPGPKYGHRIEGKTVAETWVKILHRIKTTGTVRPTGYDGKWQELIDLTAIVTDEPPDFFFPSPNYLPIDESFLHDYIPQILDDAPYIEGIKYTYGQRLRSWFKRDQVEQVINKLVHEIDAASAVMSLWDPLDHEKGGSPCLNHIWVRVVDGELSMTATFRSNDMFSAWPANAMGLRSLQRHIFDEILSRSDHNLHLGPLITISQSAHIYDDTWDNVDKLISTQYHKLSNSFDYFDPSGNFLVDVDDNSITVTQITPGTGEVVNCFSHKNPLKLIRHICSSSPSILPSHIGYLGLEIQKASQHIKSGQPYIQDR